jgi:hypothetical protein
MRFARITSVAAATGIALMLSGCGPSTSSSMPTASSSAVAAEQSTASAEAVETEPGISYVLNCYDEAGRPTPYANFREAWSEPNSSCGADYAGGQPSQVEIAAATIYAADYSDFEPIKYAEFLYGPCAETAGKYVTGPLDEHDIKLVKGALLVCPDHPKRSKMEANVKAGLTKLAADDKALQAEIKAQAAKEAERAAGKYVSEGKYLVGKDVKPGTWQSEGAKVEECYWEVSDAQGNIIANNFINVAPQFTITVPVTAAGFTVSNCSFRWIGE